MVLSEEFLNGLQERAERRQRKKTNRYIPPDHSKKKSPPKQKRRKDLAKRFIDSECRVTNKRPREPKRERVKKLRRIDSDDSLEKRKDRHCGPRSNAHLAPSDTSDEEDRQFVAPEESDSEMDLNTMFRQATDSTLLYNDDLNKKLDANQGQLVDKRERAKAECKESALLQLKSSHDERKPKVTAHVDNSNHYTNSTINNNNHYYIQDSSVGARLMGQPVSLPFAYGLSMTQQTSMFGLAQQFQAQSLSNPSNSIWSSQWANGSIEENPMPLLANGRVQEAEQLLRELAFSGNENTRIWIETYRQALAVFREHGADALRRTSNTVNITLSEFVSRNRNNSDGRKRRLIELISP